jgi:hypothetical protein
MDDSLRTPDEAIRFLGLDRQGLRTPREALRWLCRTGRLKYAKVGRYVRFRKAWLEEYVDVNTVCRTHSANRRMDSDNAHHAQDGNRTRRHVVIDD